MSIVRAKVWDEGTALLFTTSKVEVEQSLLGRGPRPQWVPKMWVSITGLRVQNEDDGSVWTVYPLAMVQWWEEVR